MISHPILIAVSVLDVVSLAAICSAAVTAFRILLDWNPESADKHQILLERRAESAAIAGRFGLAGFVLASVLLFIGISNVLPGIVPGAMCGTGVCQAADGFFGRAILFRLAFLAIVLTWLGLDRLNHSRPRAPLTMLGARVLLIGVPLQVMATIDTLRGGLRLDVQTPVECCALVYNQLDSGVTVDRFISFPGAYLVGAFILLSVVLMGTGVATAARYRFPGTAAASILAVVSILWIPIAVLALIHIFSAYIYGVLHHQCPWCLFLAEHRYIGFPLLLCIAVVGLEGVFAWIAARLRKNYPELDTACSVRIKTAALRLVGVVAGFCLMTGVPAVVWRMQYGVWIFG